MQCPGCGFENIPGRESCVVCSASLSGRKPNERVIPVRAKDRSFRERFTWAVKRSSFWADSVRRVSAGASWSSRALLTVLSAIPGFGHAAVLGAPLTGLLMFFCFILLFGGAVLFYRHPVSNLLAYAALLLSIYSVWAAARVIYPLPENPVRRTLTGLSIVLFIISGYSALYFAFMMTAASGTYRLVSYLGDAGGGIVERGDRLFIAHRPEYGRGDIIAGRMINGNIIIGPVLGIPGDSIALSGRVYVNGRATRFSIGPTFGDGGMPAAAKLGPGEYWVMPLTRMQIGNFNYALEAFNLDEDDIWGRAEAVIGPPAHRRRISPVKTGE